MARPELGEKRLCPHCGAKYYDLNRDPITCPKCGTVFDLHQVTRAKPASSKQDDEPEEDEDQASGPEFVPLDEVEAEDSGDDVPDLEEAGIEDDAATEDTFLEEEEDEGEDVTGIIRDVEDEEER